MNIIQINTIDKKGGAAMVAYSLQQELGKRGHTISMFVGRKYSEESNIKLLNDMRSISGKVRRKLAYWLANDIDVFSSDHILKTPEFKNADIVHCHNLHSNYFNLGTLEKMSQSVLKNRPISIIYNGINTNAFSPLPKEQCRKELNLPLNKKIILSVIKKQDDHWKGWAFVVETAEQFKNNKDIVFINIGRITSNKNNLLGLQPISEEGVLKKYYSATDILLYPSIADNCPLVVLEAMACGLPIVSFNTGGIQELIEHKANGYIAKHKDTDDLKNGIEYLLNLPNQELEQMRRCSIEKIKNGFTTEKTTNEYIELYNHIL